MRINERIQQIKWLEEEKILVAAGRLGGLYKLSADLQCLSSSRRLQQQGPITAMAIVGDSVITRNDLGVIVRWRLDDLTAVAVVHSTATQKASPSEWIQPLRSVSHGLTVWRDAVYAVSGVGEVLEMDIESLHVRRVLDLDEESFIESIETTADDVHIFSDFQGWLWKGHLSTGEFSKLVQIDRGPCHCVVFDRRHDRYWATTDNSGGFALVDVRTGASQLIPMTCDDVEWIAFNADASRAYVACFDHHLYIYDNSSEMPRLEKAVGPFKFQLKQVICTDDDLYILLESGEILALDLDGSIRHRSPWEGNCVWGLARCCDGNEYLLGLEDGSVRRLSVESAAHSDVHMKEVARLEYGFGRIRRIAPLADGGFVAVSSSGTIFRAESSGQILWRTTAQGICRDVSVDESAGRVAVANESDRFLELALADGSIHRVVMTGGPTWSTCYLRDGRLLVGLRRKEVLILGRDGDAPVARFAFMDNIKMIQQLADGAVAINGPSGATIYDSAGFHPIRTYDEGMTTTCESVVVSADRVFGVSYNLVLSTHERGSGVLLDEQISVHDFPKVIRAHEVSDGDAILLVAGRGPYVAAFRVIDGRPVKVREIFLQ